MQALNLLRALALEGGIVVTTPLHEAGAAPEVVAALTLIQLDGDVVNRVTEQFLENSELQKQHLRRVAGALAPFEAFGRTVARWTIGVRWAHGLATAGGYVPGLYGVMRVLQGQRDPASLWSVASLGLALANHLLGRRIRAWLCRVAIKHALGKIEARL